MKKPLFINSLHVYIREKLPKNILAKPPKLSLQSKLLVAGVAVLLFLLFWGAVQATLSVKRDKQAVSMLHYAQLQHQLGQAVVNNMLKIDLALRSGTSYAAYVEDLKRNAKFFDANLAAFKTGGVLTSGNRKFEEEEHSTDLRLLPQVQTIERDWQPIRRKMDAFLAIESTSANWRETTRATANQMATLVMANGPLLAKSTSSFINAVEIQHLDSADKINNPAIRMLLLGLFVAFVFSGYIVYFVQSREQRLFASKQESVDIFRNVNVGLLLLDNQLKISSVYSRLIEKIFNSEDIGGKSFAYLLKRVVSKEVLEQSVQYFRLLYSTKANEKIIRKNNPLTCIKISIRSNNGAVLSKYIQCEFKRVIKNGKITNIVVMINDITKSVKLEGMLHEKDLHTTMQMSTVTSFLQFEHDLVEEFIVDATHHFEEIKLFLKQQTKTHDEHVQKLNNIFRIVHQLKGDSAILKFQDLSASAHSFEGHLEKLRDMRNLNNAHFQELVSPLKDMIRRLVNVKQLFDQLNDGDWNQGEASEERMMFERLAELSQKVAKDYRKQVTLIDIGFSQSTIPRSLHKGLNGVLVQLIRNSVAHGIEDERSRLLAEKTTYGCIHLSAVVKKGQLVIKLRDDGAGIDTQKIKNVAVKTGQFSKASVDKWDTRQVMAVIMKPGFSTQSSANEHAGRGVGLDVIKSTVEKMGGRLSVATKKGLYTEFSITFSAVR